MKLKRYLTQAGIKAEAFAERIGVSSVSVYRYVAGERMPTPAVMAKIVDATGGQVQPNDFYDLALDTDPDPEEAAAMIAA